MDPKEDLRARIAAFLERERPKPVVAYLSDAGFVAHLVDNWKGPELVVAIVERETDVRGSLTKRADAFAWANAKDTFAKHSRLVMYADARGVTFDVLDPS